MADAVTTVVLAAGPKKFRRVFTNVSDGTGESAVVKFDISAITGGPTKVKINRVSWSCSGMVVRVLFDHTTDDTVLILDDKGSFDFRDSGGLHDPASAGDTGDILFTTIGHTSGDTYCIDMEIEADL